MVNQWSEELTLLSEIAITQPQSAYACFVGGYQHRFSYIIRTIPNMKDYLQPIEDIIRHQFIPAITDGKVVNDLERNLLSLPPNMGGFGLKNIRELAPIEHENSKNFTKNLQNEILNLEPPQDAERKSISTIKSEKTQRNREKQNRLKAEMNYEQKRLHEANCCVGASNWLTNLPIKDQGTISTKNSFKTRYEFATTGIFRLCHLNVFAATNLTSVTRCHVRKEVSLPFVTTNYVTSPPNSLMKYVSM